MSGRVVEWSIWVQVSRTLLESHTEGQGSSDHLGGGRHAMACCFERAALQGMQAKAPHVAIGGQMLSHIRLWLPPTSRHSSQHGRTLQEYPTLSFSCLFMMTPMVCVALQQSQYQRVWRIVWKDSVCQSSSNLNQNQHCVALGLSQCGVSSLVLCVALERVAATDIHRSRLDSDADATMACILTLKPR